MRISCSIVCYRNSPAQVERALASVTSSSAEFALFLVDNSGDDTLAPVARKFGATYIHLAHNPGFGAAHNVAMREALALGCDYHLVMNPDISFGDNVVPALLDYMEQHREIGLVMPNVFYPDGQQQYLCKLLPNPFDLMMRRFFPALYRFSGRLANYEMHHSGYDKIMDVPALSGCFMLIRSGTLREVGNFDERFFMYLEDVDLSRRIGRLARTVYFPHVSVVHDYGKGSYKSLKLLYYHLRSAVQYFNKWGWFSDVEKKRVNRIAIQKLRSINSTKK
ncbi:MAG: glycosyltransferase family 2 protein [Burkholderiaceae bacterium]|nr:glycosyltransferase family 2 protein [Burkholderiaceae bacterium]